MNSKLNVMKIMKLFFVPLICLVALTAMSCKNSTQTTADNSRESLDWTGVYTSVLPCADCDGIQTTITLTLVESYELQIKYLGKEGKELVKTGSFKWNKAGSEITLSGIKNNEAPSKYLVGENKLIQLDTKGKRMDSEVEFQYTLTKVSDIVERHWKLIELNGTPITPSEHQAIEPYFILKVENNRVVGNGGCNSVNGAYVIENGNRIKFSQMISTMMACANMETESQFLQVLNNVDNYTLNNDTLSLNRARMAPLARFAAVDME